MRALTLGLLAAATALTGLTGCTTAYDDGPNTGWRTYRNYDYDRPDPQYGG